MKKPSYPKTSSKATNNGLCIAFIDLNDAKKYLTIFLFEYYVLMTNVLINVTVIKTLSKKRSSIFKLNNVVFVYKELFESLIIRFCYFENK